MGEIVAVGDSVIDLTALLLHVRYRVVMLVQAPFQKNFGMRNTCDFYIPICHTERRLICVCL